MSPRSPNDPFFEDVYDELRALAESKLRAGLGGTSIQATGIVHDVWLKLSERPADADLDRSRYFATAAQAMRWILVDRARRRRSKTIASVFGAPEPTAPQGADPSSADLQLLALDEALDRLEEAHPRKAAVVGHRFFAGLSVEDTAALMGVSTATVKREWSFARAWLLHALDGDPAPDPV